jgi:tripartite-type tricarboxylate transporter receptor subunit TctC
MKAITTMLLWAAFAAHAQDYPARPVRLLVGYPPGGGMDTMARVVAPKLSEALGQQFVVENRPGASGGVAAEALVKSTPDGHVLMVAESGTLALPAVNPKVTLDPLKQLAPIGGICTLPMAFVVNVDFPARSVADLVRELKANPGKYSYASPGTGTPGHLVGEQFRLSLGLDLVHVPFNSAGLAVGSSVAGHTPICFASPSPAAQQVIEGRLRGLAVSSKTRSQALPDVPTMAEAGYPDIAGDNWQGVVVPAGTSKEIIAFLHREIVKVIARPDTRERLSVLGFEPVASTPEEFARRAKVEFDTWAGVIRASGIKAE